MGKLPVERVTADRVFERTGIYSAGPLCIKYSCTRKPTEGSYCCAHTYWKLSKYLADLSIRSTFWMTMEWRTWPSDISSLGLLYGRCLIAHSQTNQYHFRKEGIYVKPWWDIVGRHGDKNIWCHSCNTLNGTSLEETFKSVIWWPLVKIS